MDIKWFNYDPATTLFSDFFKADDGWIYGIKHFFMKQSDKRLFYILIQRKKSLQDRKVEFSF